MSAAPLPRVLAELNAASPAAAVAALQTCCGSRRWAEAMAARRPFANESEAIEAATTQWNRLDRDDWLEAFSHHPRIGERKLEQPKFDATREQSTREQSGMAAAGDAVRAEFERLNADYEKKFCHIFLICATGRTAEFMLGELQRRIALTPDEELLNAAEQQNMITHLRLKRMLQP